jgi:hypothetical protein
VNYNLHWEQKIIKRIVSRELLIMDISQFVLELTGTWECHSGWNLVDLQHKSIFEVSF